MSALKQIPEQDIPDNVPQQQILEDLIAAKQDARVYLIRDKRPGCGKTLLQRRLAWACRRPRITAPYVLAAAIDLEDHVDLSPYALVTKLAQQLGFDYLPGFDHLRRARAARNVTAFVGDAAASVPTVAGVVDARGATIRDQAQVAGLIINDVEKAFIHIPDRAKPEWTADVEEIADEKLIRAFFKDLRTLPDDRVVVLFIDSVDEKAKSRESARWVRETLLAKVFLDAQTRPKNAILCLAGRDLPDYAGQLEPEAFKTLIQAPGLLTGWQVEDTKTFLRLMLGQSPEGDVIEVIHQRIVGKAALPLLNAYLSVFPLVNYASADG